MTDKELIRRALLGDQEAQKECTEKGIVLPCPCCGRSMEMVSNGFAHTNTKCILNLRYFKFTDTELISLWNTRPAPPVGRCEDCKWSYKPTEQDYIRIGSDAISYNDACVCNFLEPADIRHKNDFCSYFEPREK